MEIHERPILLQTGIVKTTSVPAESARLPMNRGYESTGPNHPKQSMVAYLFENPIAFTKNVNGGPHIQTEIQRSQYAVLQQIDPHPTYRDRGFALRNHEMVRGSDSEIDV